MTVSRADSAIQRFYNMIKGIKESIPEDEPTIYGTIIDSNYIKLDGSTQYTPFSNDLTVGERVNVTVRNHKVELANNLISNTYLETSYDDSSLQAAIDDLTDVITGGGDDNTDPADIVPEILDDVGDKIKDIGDDIDDINDLIDDTTDIINDAIQYSKEAYDKAEASIEYSDTAYDSVYPITSQMRGLIEKGFTEADIATASVTELHYSYEGEGDLAKAKVEFNSYDSRSASKWDSTYTAQIDASAKDTPSVRALLYGFSSSFDSSVITSDVRKLTEAAGETVYLSINYYAASDSSTEAPADNSASTEDKTVTKTVTKEVTDDDGNPVYNEDGSVKTEDVPYEVDTVELNINDSWEAGAPSLSDEKNNLWMYSVYYTTDDKTYTTDKTYICACPSGATSENSIIITKNYYMIASSSPSMDDSGWDIDYPDKTDGEYIWNYSTTQYHVGTPGSKDKLYENGALYALNSAKDLYTEALDAEIKAEEAYSDGLAKELVIQGMIEAVEKEITDLEKELDEAKTALEASKAAKEAGEASSTITDAELQALTNEYELDVAAVESLQEDLEATKARNEELKVLLIEAQKDIYGYYVNGSGTEVIGTKDSYDGIKTVSGYVKGSKAKVEEAKEALEKATNEVNTAVNGLHMLLSTSIIQTAEKIQLLAKKVDANGEAFSKLTITAEGIEALVKDAQGNLSKITQTAKAIQAKVTDLNGNVATLTTKANEIEAKVTDIEGNVGTLTTKANEIEAKVTDLNGNVGTLTTKATEIEAKVTNLDGKIGSLSVTADQVQSKVDDTKGNVATLTTELDNITARVADADKNVGTLTTKATEIEAKVEDADKNVGTLTTKATEIEAKVADADKNVGTLTTKATEIEGKVEDADKNIGTLTTKATEIEAKVTDIEGNVGTLTTKANEIEAKVKDANDNYTSIKEKADGVTTEIQSYVKSASDSAAEASEYATEAKNNSFKTVIRETNLGILVCKTNAEYGSLMTADGNFANVGIGWTDGEPYITYTVAAFAPTGIEGVFYVGKTTTYNYTINASTSGVTINLNLYNLIKDYDTKIITYLKNGGFRPISPVKILTNHKKACKLTGWNFSPRKANADVDWADDDSSAYPVVITLSRNGTSSIKTAMSGKLYLQILWVRCSIDMIDDTTFTEEDSDSSSDSGSVDTVTGYMYGTWNDGKSTLTLTLEDA